MIYGPHTPYVVAAYGISFIVIGALTLSRWLSLREWRRREASSKEKPEA